MTKDELNKLMGFAKKLKKAEVHDIAMALLDAENKGYKKAMADADRMYNQAVEEVTG